MIHEATLYRVEGPGKIRCTACSRYCLLGEGQTGFCGVRRNEGGSHDLLVYGRPLAANVDPIEKKPIMHMKQGTCVYSIGTAGCNFACQFCQNYELSQRRRVEGSMSMTPENVVHNAIATGCDGIAFTYNEPTIFTEYARDIGKLAHREGLFTVFVSNGYETVEAIREMDTFLDAITVDFKGNASRNFYRRYISVPDPENIYAALTALSETGIHVEITDLVVPEVGDSLEDAAEMLRRVREILGNEVPVSFLRFHPDYRMMYLPETPYHTLLRHREAAIEAGMKYVYIGNVPHSEYQNTFCPECGGLCIERDMVHTIRILLDEDGRRPSCGYGTGIKL